jgi:hypothetical protein
MVLSESIQDYGDYIRHELGHAITTYYSYRSWQRNFARWPGESGTSPAGRARTGCPTRRSAMWA